MKHRSTRRGDGGTLDAARGRPWRRALLALACAGLPAAATAQGTPVLKARWLSRYDGPARHTDQMAGLAVVPQGDSFVTGTSAGVSSGRAKFGIATLRYDPAGRRQWLARYEPTVFDAAAGIVVDGDENVYVVGSTTPAPPFPDILLLKYAPDGRLLWTWSYDEFDNNDEGVDVALDPAGNVVVVGHANGLTGADYYTVMLDPAGSVLWSARYHGGAASEVDVPVAVATDARGGVYVTGTSKGTSTVFRDDIVTVAYDPQGNELWVRRYDGPAAGIDEPAGIVVDARGDVIVSGSSDGGKTSFDVVTIKYAADGTVLWTRRYHGSRDGSDAGIGLCVDDQGDIYVAGNSYRSSTGFDVLTLKYDTGGSLRWKAFYDGGEARGDHGREVCVDGLGRVFVSGQSYHLASSVDQVVLAYDAQHGRQLGVAHYDGPSSRIDYADFIGTDALGNAFLAGSSDPAAMRISDMTLIKYALEPDCTGTVGRFGVPCADGSEQSNVLDRAGCPEAGSTMRVAMATGTPGPCVLAIGFQTGSWMGYRLPYPLDPLGAPGCRVHSSLEILKPFGANTGEGVFLDLALPPLPAGSELRAYFQGFHFDPSANALGLVASDAFVVTVRPAQ